MSTLSVSIELEHPLELLLSCHDKVRYFSALTDRLADHVRQHGVDAEASQAAVNILRYFELALPNHHADEEKDVFPALGTLNDAAVNSAIATLLAEHVRLDKEWCELHPWLRRVAQGVAQQDEVPSGTASFAWAYMAHAEHEEHTVFPAIERLPPETVASLANSMRARRGG
jgi:hemerythrin-like domain-containing protein